jgi:hypothetical protein
MEAEGGDATCGSGRSLTARPRPSAERQIKNRVRVHVREEDIWNKLLEPQPRKGTETAFAINVNRRQLTG